MATFHRVLRTGLCLLAAAPSAAETFNLVTYYPAPSGVYSRMITTDNTFLARDSGRVGVGTTSPIAKLHVEEAGDATVLVRAGLNGRVSLNLLEATSPNFGAVIRYYGDVNDRLSFLVGAPPAAERMTILRGSGFVGMGTNNPSTQLEVAGLGGGNVDLVVNGRLRTGDAGSSGGVWLSRDWNMFVGQFCSGVSCDNVGFWTAGMGWNTLMIKQNGSVGIGTVSPFMIHGDNDRVLEVRGDVCGWNWWGHRLCMGGDSFGNDVELAIYDNAASPSNNIAFYNARRGIYADTFARSFTVSSSRRFKENIRPLNGALEKVRKLEGVSFDYKEDKKHAIGFVAEDVAQVVPEAVKFGDQGAEGVDYSRLVPLLVEAVKEQQRRIETLEKELGARK